MAADTQVSKYTIHFTDPVQLQEPADMPEIMRLEKQSRI
jgi:hypothetical protein